MIGANIAICLVALEVGAFIAPLPFGKHIRRYALFSVPIGAIAAASVWDGQVDRLEGVFLVGLYILYIAIIWIVERHPPTLGETEEIEAAQAKLATTEPNNTQFRISKELLLVLAGIIAMAIGATLLVEAVRQISNVEETQTKLGLTLIGFATAFELVVLAWSSARRGVSKAMVAGVVGSFAYNATRTYPTNARKPDIGCGKEQESIKTYFQAFPSNNKSSILALKPGERALLLVTGYNVLDWSALGLFTPLLPFFELWSDTFSPKFLTQPSGIVSFISSKSFRTTFRIAPFASR